jgi:hypothetical protein
MQRADTPLHTSSIRTGVASLELVLVLPVLLFITALIIIFGALATWRIEGQTLARNAVWQRRWPRTIAEPVPAAWQPGTAGVDGAAAYDVLDEQSMNLPVARGPLPAATVDTDLLDFTRGGSRGLSQKSLPIPITSRQATADISSEHPLLGGVWTYDGTKMGGNVERRTKVLYQLAKAPSALSQAYIAAVVAIYTAAYQRDLVPLDKEPDFPRFGQGSPDFHPRLAWFCGLDAVALHDNAVVPLVERIVGVYTPQRHVPGVAETMTRSFLSLYQGAIRQLEDQLNADPPPSPAQRARIQSQLDALHAELDPKIAQLQAYLSQLTGQ